MKAYFSMETVPSVFFISETLGEWPVLNAIEKLGYRAYVSGVGGEASLV